MEELKYLQEAYEIVRKLIPLIKDFKDKKLASFLSNKEKVLKIYIKVFYDDLTEKEKIQVAIDSINQFKPYLVKFQDFQFAADLTEKESNLLDRLDNINN